MYISVYKYSTLSYYVEVYNYSSTKVNYMHITHVGNAESEINFMWRILNQSYYVPIKYVKN